MARFMTIAAKMAARIEEMVPALAGRAIVFRRDTVQDQFERRMRMATGRCVVVRLLATRPAGKGRRVLVESGLYTVTLFTVPLLTDKAALEADDLMAAIKAALQGWWPADVSSNTTWTVDCRGSEYLDSLPMSDGRTTCDAIKLTVAAPGNLD